MTANRGPDAWAAAWPHVGRRCRWHDDGHLGTITGLTTSANGYVHFLIEWDSGAPRWWGTEILVSSKALEVIVDGP